MSRDSKYVVIWSISREEIKAVHKLKLCEEEDDYLEDSNEEDVYLENIYCSTKSDLFAFIRTDGSVGIANFRTREIVTKVSGWHAGVERY